MGRRSNPLGLRVGGLLNWPSTVKHEFLTKFVKHLFQNSISAPISIRSSTTQIWIHVTVLNPKFKPPATLDFRSADISKVLGRSESRTRSLAKTHNYYSKIFKNAEFKSIMEACDGNNSNEALQIYRDCDIGLRLNVIQHPILNADILAQYISLSLSSGSNAGNTVSRILKSIAA